MHRFVLKILDFHLSHGTRLILFFARCRPHWLIYAQVSVTSSQKDCNILQSVRIPRYNLKTPPRRPISRITDLRRILTYRSNVGIHHSNNISATIAVCNRIHLERRKSAIVQPERFKISILRHVLRATSPETLPNKKLSSPPSTYINVIRVLGKILKIDD
jgi:hypothetical protein